MLFKLDLETESALPLRSVSMFSFIHHFLRLMSLNIEVV